MPVMYGNDRGRNALGVEDQLYITAKMIKNISRKTVFDKMATITEELPRKQGDTVTFEKNVPMFELMYYEQLNKKYALGFDLALGRDLEIILPRDEYTNYILPEGSSGDEKGKLSTVQMTAKVIPIGMWRGYTEELDLFAKRWNLKREAENQGEVASQIIDGFYRDLYSSSTTNVQDLTDNDNDDDKISSTAFSSAVERAKLAMELQGARPCNIIISSSPEHGTIPVTAYFKMFIPSTATIAIRKNPDFVPIEKAGISDNQKLNDQEFEMRLEGFIKGVEVYSVPTMYAEYNDDGSNLAEVLIFGKDHTAQIPVRGMKRIEYIVKALGENGDDRLNRVGSVGWKSWLGAKTIYPERLAKILVNYTLD
jgi:N4-gp56 family major capsid protein